MGAPAIACSVAPNYRVPTNLELASRANVILLGIVEGELKSADEYSQGQVIVRPTVLLKGASLPQQVRLNGHLSSDPRWVAASSPRELHQPNPGALIGGCTRYIFQRGMLLLLFLKQDEEGTLSLAPYPFARSAEDVPDAQAPWVKATRFYIEVAALPASQQRGALVARRDSLRAAVDDPDAKTLADDIDRQIRRRRIPRAIS